MRLPCEQWGQASHLVPKLSEPQHSQGGQRGIVLLQAGDPVRHPLLLSPDHIRWLSAAAAGSQKRS